MKQAFKLTAKVKVSVINTHEERQHRKAKMSFDCQWYKSRFQNNTVEGEVARNKEGEEF